MGSRSPWGAMAAWAAGAMTPLCASRLWSQAGCRYHRTAWSWAQLSPSPLAMLTRASHPHLGLVSLCLGTQERGPDCASLGLDLCCGCLLKREFGPWSKQDMFLRRTTRTSCLRLRERAQCPDPAPVGQATQNHLQGGDIALSQRVSPLLCPMPSLALHLGLQSSLP